MDGGALQKPLPPRSLSRSDVVAWREWRRCIHESRWCSPTKRCWERGVAKGKQGDWWRKQGEEETRKWEWKRRWLRETDEEGECERGQIDEWMFVHAAARQMPIYHTKWVFRIEVMFRKRLEGDGLGFKAPPCFHLQMPPEWSFKKTKIN